MQSDDPVPRETSASSPTPEVPVEAGRVFAARLDVAVRYAQILVTDGVARGLLGPRESPRIWDRHLLNCAVLTDEMAPGDNVCDIGAGAGLPGVVLSIRRPDLRVTLVEPLLRRATFLTETVRRLGLDNVEVVRARAEELHGRWRFDVVTSRAVAPLPRLLDWSMPLVRPGGQLLAMKGRSAADDLTAAEAEVRRWGGRRAEVRQLGATLLAVPTTVIRLEAGDDSELQWRRSPGRGDERRPRHQRRRGRRP